MSKVLVTGANGYIGRHIVETASVLGYEIIAVDFRPYAAENIHSVTIDVLQEAEAPDLYRRLGKPEHIIHLAWQDGFNHKAESHIKNLSAHFAFIKNMIDSGCPSISVMGTMHEIGYYEGKVDENTPCNPMSPYGIAKNALRQLVLAYCEDRNVSLKWLRAFYITGDDGMNKSVFAKILEMAKNGQETFPFTSGANKYDFEDINVLAHQIVVAATQTKINGIINCCSGQAVSLKDKVEEFIKSHNLSIQPEYGAYPSRKYDSPAIWGDATKIKMIMEMENE